MQIAVLLEQGHFLPTFPFKVSLVSAPLEKGSLVLCHLSFREKEVTDLECLLKADRLKINDGKLHLWSSVDSLHRSQSWKSCFETPFGNHVQLRHHSQHGVNSHLSSSTWSRRANLSTCCWRDVHTQKYFGRMKIFLVKVWPHLQWQNGFEGKFLNSQELHMESNRRAWTQAWGISDKTWTGMGSVSLL